MKSAKWPKTFPPLTPEQEFISNDFMKYWHEILADHAQYSLLNQFNHCYPVKHVTNKFLNTLEIGAGIGGHLPYEKLSAEQKKNYVALELRQNMADQLKVSHPDITVFVGDCQQSLPFANNHFDRILAIHVLEHLPNLPDAIKEMYRLCEKKQGIISIVIPCEGGKLYSLARKISAKRLFEKRYKQPYKWFIEREHINVPQEILAELHPYFKIIHRSYFPFMLPFIDWNLCIGVTLRPRW